MTVSAGQYQIGMAQTRVISGDMGLKLKPFGFQAATDRSILSQEKKNLCTIYGQAITSPA